MNVQGMYRVVCTVSFEQTPNETYPNRGKKFLYNFLSEYEAVDGWTNLTNDAKVIVPKNIYVRDENDKLVPLAGTNANIGGFSNDNPLFMRGDKVTLNAGYRYFDAQGNEKYTNADIFTGFVRSVSSKQPVLLTLEDNMYLLKQIQAQNQTYPAGTTLESIATQLLQGTGFKVNALTQTTVGEFTTHNETVAQVLARLNKDYHFYAYFRGGELRIGSQVYLEQDAVDSGQKRFVFQDNIISDGLDYNRTEDIELSAVAYSVNKIELETTTKRGHKRTKHKRLEALVTIGVGGKTTKYVRDPNDQRAEFAPNVQGERRTLYFWDVPDGDKLAELALAELKKYYYRGFVGKFVTFGIPFVRMGDNVDVIDPVLPERNGRYKVKSVRSFGGASAGLKQEIELEYLITRLDSLGNVIA